MLSSATRFRARGTVVLHFPPCGGRRACGGSRGARPAASVRPGAGPRRGRRPALPPRQPAASGDGDGGEATLQAGRPRRRAC